MSLFRELLEFMRVRKKFCAAHHSHHGAAGGLLVLVQGSAVAPFIYTLF